MNPSNKRERANHLALEEAHTMPCTETKETSARVLGCYWRVQPTIQHTVEVSFCRVAVVSTYVHKRTSMSTRAEASK
jgi:hypothetical protein